MTTHVDYLVVGQGLCGTLLSRQLLKLGQRVLVMDDDHPFSASRVASGVINPVTGRRIVRTWRIEELLPFAQAEYAAIGQELGVSVATQCNILDFHPTLQMREAFEKRRAEGETFLKSGSEEEPLKAFFRFNYGIGEIDPCVLVNLQLLLAGWRDKLRKAGALLEEKFDWQNCVMDNGHVTYRNVVAKTIVCCEGVSGFDNPYFKNLPYTRMKGEALIVSIPGLPRNNIYKQGLNIVPWSDDLFWVGSTYEWDFKDVLPTAAWRTKVEEQLKYWLKLPFEVREHLASERPANVERRPFVGVHPVHPQVAILNGMGAKGCSLAPFFAHQLARHLVASEPIYADADVKRFSKVLTRGST